MRMAHLALAISDEPTRLLLSQYPNLFESKDCLHILDYHGPYGPYLFKK